MKRTTSLFVGVGLLAIGALAQAQQTPWSGSVKSGEAGYKIGASAAQQLGIPCCAELPSGRGWNREPEFSRDLGNGSLVGPGGEFRYSTGGSAGSAESVSR